MILKQKMSSFWPNTAWQNTAFYKSAGSAGALIILLLATPSFCFAEPEVEELPAPVSTQIPKIAGYSEIDLQYSSERTRSTVSSGIERHLRFGVFAGAQYHLQIEKHINFGAFIKTDRGDILTTDFSQYAVGAFLGLALKNFSLRLAYSPFAELKTRDIATDTSWHEGSGYEIKAAWLTSVAEDSSRDFMFGPSLSYEKMTYKKMQLGSLPEIAKELSHESIIPGITFSFSY